MPDEVVAVNKPSNVTRIAWFVAGIFFSSVVIYNVPQSVEVSNATISTVVEKAPVVASSVAGWVSDTVAGMSKE